MPQGMLKTIAGSGCGTASLCRWFPRQRAAQFIGDKVRGQILALVAGGPCVLMMPADACQLGIS